METYDGRLPHRIPTKRLVLRCWHEDDAPLLRDAIDTSLDHLRRWMPWALDEPSSVERTRERLRGHRESFASGEDFVFGIFSSDESEVVGVSGLHPRIGDGGLEIGYWIRASRTGHGFATEAAQALTAAGLGAPGIDRIQIQCDPDNAASRRVPEKLGYRLVETRHGDKRTPAGDVRDTLVFEQRREWVR